MGILAMDVGKSKNDELLLRVLLSAALISYLFTTFVREFIEKTPLSEVTRNLLGETVMFAVAAIGAGAAIVILPFFVKHFKTR